MGGPGATIGPAASLGTYTSRSGRTHGLHTRAAAGPPECHYAALEITDFGADAAAVGQLAAEVLD